MKYGMEKRRFTCLNRQGERPFFDAGEDVGYLLYLESEQNTITNCTKYLKKVKKSMINLKKN